MVFAHIALGSFGYKLTHFAVWFDGAMGFVLLSGLVVGLVQRKTAERAGLRAAAVKVWKRARLVYVAHLAICVLAFALAATTANGKKTFASLDSLGGWWQTIVATGTLQINPPRAAILSLYVILLLLTPVASFLLQHNLTWALIGTAITAFIAGHTWPELLTLPRQPGEFGEINVATWQLAYFLAFICGWNWRAIRTLLDKFPIWIIATTITVMIVTYGRLSTWESRPSYILWAFGSGQMGPATVLLAFTIITMVFPLLTWANKRAPHVTGLVARIGRRSLDSYIILALIVLPVQTIAPYERSALLADFGALGALLLMWIWSRVRDRHSASQRGRRSGT